jgi:DNA (cytosine-5)-methyltransferase 1
MDNGRVYYNEWDEFAARWLGELMHDGLIPRGEIDRRSIVDVRPGDLEGFDQCHFFAGIGGWAYALELAGWRGRRAWTGSCPCQPLSGAGQRKGHADERHLWPAFHNLIAECRPSTVFGEQVASDLGREWVAGIRADLEASRYAVGIADLTVAGVGAPHIRQRLWWVADANGRFSGDGGLQSGGQYGQLAQDGGTRDGMADASDRHGGGGERGAEAGIGKDRIGRRRSSSGSEDGGMANADEGKRGRLANSESCQRNRASSERFESDGEPQSGSAPNRQQRPWDNGILIRCLDGRSRRVPANEKGEPEPALFPLATGISNRVGTLRGAGNAINPWLAADFIRACM